MKSLIKRVLIAVTGNRLMQRALDLNVTISQYLMGIGTGDFVSSSGERSIFEVVAKRSAGPYCIFDVGANAGQFLKLIRQSALYDRAAIHCFEPGKETFAILTRNVADDAKVTANNIALAAQPGQATLHYDEEGSGLASLTKRQLEHRGIPFEGAATVTVDTIDNYCRRHAIARIDLLKLDIEGHEYDALLGAQSMFDSGSIDVVTFEFGGTNIDSRVFFVDYWRFFQKAGMQLLRITPSGYLHPIRSYAESHEQFTTTNFIAIRSSTAKA